MKDIIFDSSSIISLTSINLLSVLSELKKREKVNFLITQGVYDEVIIPGEKNYRFGWSSEQIQNSIDSGLLGVKKLTPPQEKEYVFFEDLVNNILSTKYGPIQILQKGELESIIFLAGLTDKKLFCIDELITRELIDDPKRLKSILDKRYKTTLYMDETKLTKFKEYIGGVKVIRSVDLTAYAFNKDYFKQYGTNKDTHLIKSLLYALKDNGCAVLYEEIENYVKKI